MLRIIILGLAVTGIAFAADVGPGGKCEKCACKAAVTDGAATVELEKGERKLLEIQAGDEQLAHDLYGAFADQWKLQVFSHIQGCEARHIQAVGSLAKKYGIESTPLKKNGKLSDQKIRKLYQRLLKQGKASKTDALRAAAFVEEYDLAQQAKVLKESSNPDIQVVFTQLQHASQNHLRAFVRNLESEGVKYQAQVLETKTVQSILSEPSSCGLGCGKCGGGPGQGKGRGPGRGPGRGKGRA